MPIHNTRDWARERAGGGAEALQRRAALRGGTGLSVIVIYHPRVATRRGRPGNVRKGKVVKSSSDWGLHNSIEWVGDLPRRFGRAKSRHMLPSHFAPYWVVSAAGASGMEQFPLVQGAGEGVLSMCLPF
jgi:hypothetical protein